MPTLAPTPPFPLPTPSTSGARRRPGDCSTDELVRAARAGDSDAAGELYRRTWRCARRVAGSFCRAADADDAVAEGLSRALLRLHQLRDPASAESWLLRSVVRAAIDGSRQHRRQRILGARATFDGQAFATVEPADEAALGAFEREAMAAALAELPAAQRRLLQLRYASGTEVRTIASTSGTPEGTVRRQCVEARRLAGQRFLYHHLRPATDRDCARVTNLLCREPYRRPGPRLRRQATEHLRRCSACRDRQRELSCLLRELGYRRQPR